MLNEASRRVDLHVHTSFSDSSFSPEEVVTLALERGLSAIAITDHDCVDAVPHALAAAGTKLEVLAGIEMSTELKGVEIHILGLGVDWQDTRLQQHLRELRQRRLQRLRKMIHKLRAFDIDIAEQDVLALTRKDGAAGRLHLARALTARGFVTSPREAFRRFIGQTGPCYVSHTFLPPRKIIEIISRAGGVPILAHPGTMGNDELIPELVGQGMRGLEAFHSDHSESERQYYRQMAKRLQVLISGGSDCHGTGKGTPALGTVAVPYAVLQAIKDELKKRPATFHAPEPDTGAEN